jgi:hypothetical protein
VKWDVKPCGGTHVGVWIGGSEEDWFELVHAGICEEERWVVERDRGGGGDVLVTFGPEELNEERPHALSTKTVVHFQAESRVNWEKS